ncbi:hypothetical protein Vadar_020907 [Vaccinium darrowii]|uniref:Uncharacterized protein n=1 Tax=Vaccinium darrowii TaxID=229202 RepID=A0ACB7Y8B9_9ERIC|nr:hypothetical protein Vadar_020907 [Vaccinium darrowii]
MSIRAWMRAVFVASPQCSCCSQDDIAAEHHFEEFQSTFPGHMSIQCLKGIYWDIYNTCQFSKLGQSVPR